MSVGVMKDYKLKLWKLHASHTLGCPWNVSHLKTSEFIMNQQSER
jgi:hypothetical protein